MSSRRLETLFPRLNKGEYRITSPATTEYNCFAWAVSDVERVWDPEPFADCYWPEGSARNLQIESLISVYSAYGYELCSDSELEDGFEKLALYVDEVGNTTHAARQLSNGKWTSKIGDYEDIEHQLEALTGRSNTTYGQISCFLRRRRS